MAQDLNKNKQKPHDDHRSISKFHSGRENQLSQVTLASINKHTSLLSVSHMIKGKIGKHFKLGNKTKKNLN